MISKIDGQRKCKSGNNEGKKEGKQNCRRLRNELKRTTDEAKKEYLESTCDRIMEFKRTGHYDLMCMKMKELG
jgi:hypothetical protein